MFTHSSASFTAALAALLLLTTPAIAQSTRAPAPPVTRPDTLLARRDTLLARRDTGRSSHTGRAPRRPWRSVASRDTTPALSPTTPLPLDPAVATGTLANGMRYYVRANREPRRRAELRLVVNAGSVVEDSAQRGLAHFVEHMAFSGTTNFPRQQLVRYLESVGMSFGPDLNASTGFDETVYQLTVPTDSAALLERSLQILDDWARGITFDSAQVARERGVVLEEWRLSRGAGARVQERLLPVLLRGSRYARRLPIGDTAVLRSATPADLRRFYEQWYRPDLMAVVVVGDFDRDSVVRLVRQRFGRIPRAATPRALPVYPVPAPDSMRVAVATDPELTASSVSVVALLPVEPAGTVSDFRRELAESLADAMFNDRLGAIAQRPGAPFLGAGGGEGRLARSAFTYSLSARVRDGALALGLGALWGEWERVQRFGFTATELERARRNLLRGYEQAYAERDKTPSASYAGSYANNFLTGEPASTIAFEYRLAQRLAPGITLGELNALERTRTGGAAPVVLAAATAASDSALPTPAALRSVLDSAARAPLTAYVDSAIAGALVERPPAPAAIVSERALPAVNALEWRLANGVRVVLKPTDFANDQVLVSAWAPGGTSLAPDSLIVPAQSAASLVDAMGLGRYSPVQLERALAGTAVGVSPYIDELTQGVSGSASARDLRTLFELIYLTFTAPRADTAAFEAYRTRLLASLVDRSNSPEAAFADTLDVLLSQRSPRRPLPTEGFAERLDIARSLAFYRSRFGNAGAFTFYIVGSFEPDSLRPLVERWLGGLPATGAPERWVDRGVRYPDGVVLDTVRRGREPKALAAVDFTGPIEFTPRNAYRLGTLARVLELRLRTLLRQTLGETYYVSVAAYPEQYPTPRYRMAIRFGGAPARLDAMLRAVFQQVDSLRAAGPTAAELASVTRSQLRAREVALRENWFWISQLEDAEQEGWPLTTVRGFPDLVRALDRGSVRAAARQYLDTTRYVQVTLVPADSAAAARGGSAAEVRGDSAVQVPTDSATGARGDSAASPALRAPAPRPGEPPTPRLPGLEPRRALPRAKSFRQ